MTCQVDSKYATKIDFKIRINAARTIAHVLTPAMVSKHNININTVLNVLMDAIVQPL
jgi:hypothetical protein